MTAAQKKWPNKELKARIDAESWDISFYHTHELWERAMASSGLEDQKRLIAALDAARDQCILE